MIRKLKSGEHPSLLCKNPGKRRNLGALRSRAAAKKHERAVQYFKRHQSRSPSPLSVDSSPQSDGEAPPSGALVAKPR